MPGTVLASAIAHVENAVRRAVAVLFPQLPNLADVDPLVRPSTHADLQSNVAMSLAERVCRRPAELAQEIAEQLTDRSAISAVVSGPGFINITLPPAQLWRRAQTRLADPRLGVRTSRDGERTVIDYSAPNIAKEMHVGHLRTTVIGDCLVRVLRHLGAVVIPENHVGDWGTQFGMLIQFLDEHPEQPWHLADLPDAADSVSALDSLYRAARSAFDADPAFADRARTRVVALQAGDPATLGVWQEIVDVSQCAFQALYQRLGVLLTHADAVGESFYNRWLGEVVDELLAAGIAVDSQCALCVFDPQVLGPDGDPIPLIVRKRDGGYGYDTTDLATLRYRVRELRANRLLYVVDARQALHFRLVFSAARRAGWVSDDHEVRHVEFGTVLGPDGRPFRTRAGGTVRLNDLLDEAVARARVVVAQKQPDLPVGELEALAEIVGIASVKYADLSTSRIKDYTFDVNRMVSFTGDTAAYLQYAFVRAGSILRRAADRYPETAVDPVGLAALVDPAVPLLGPERALILRLDAFADCLSEVADTLEPHRLCGYLYELARTFTDFFEVCPVLTADTDAERKNRLALCQLTASTLHQGLDLLGLDAPARL